MSVKILKNLKGEFVSSEVVKAATQKEYNQSAWNSTVERYAKYEEVKFFKTIGKIYEFDYYVIYIADGIRFLGEVSYSSGLSSGGFAYGFFTEGIKDKEMLEKLKDVPGMEGIGEDSLTIMSHVDGRINTSEAARQYMRTQTNDINCRFYTKKF